MLIRLNILDGRGCGSLEVPVESVHSDNLKKTGSNQQSPRYLWYNHERCDILLSSTRRKRKLSDFPSSLPLSLLFSHPPLSFAFFLHSDRVLSTPDRPWTLYVDREEWPWIDILDSTSWYWDYSPASSCSLRGSSEQAQGSVDTWRALYLLSYRHLDWLLSTASLPPSLAIYLRLAFFMILCLSGDYRYMTPYQISLHIF